MSDDRDLLKLIGEAGEQNIRLNHLSAEMHQDNVQRTIASVITLNQAMNGKDTDLERVLANPTSKP